MVLTGVALGRSPWPGFRGRVRVWRPQAVARVGIQAFQLSERCSAFAEANAKMNKPI